MAELPSVMIVGAGGAGRLLGQGLQKRGYKVTLFERDATIDTRQRDWDYGVHWGTALLKDLLPEHITLEKVLAAQVDDIPPSPDSKINTYNGLTAELIAQLPLPNMMRLRRREFCRVIGEGLDIHYDKGLVSVAVDEQSGRVTATFADGSTHEADFLIGAEGSRSAARAFLVGEEAARNTPPPVGMAMCRPKLPLAQIDEFKRLGERLWIAFHPEGGYALMIVHDSLGKPDPETWLFSLIMSWQLVMPHRGPPPGDGLPVTAEMKKICATYGEPFRSIFAAMSEDDETAWSGTTGLWATVPWPDHPARGRVTLIGDAMHAVLPQRGQGMNNAILDCVEFFKALDAQPEQNAVGFGAAVRTYEEEAWKRGKEIAEESVENALSITGWERLKESPLWKFGIAQRAKAEAS